MIRDDRHTARAVRGDETLRAFERLDCRFIRELRFAGGSDEVHGVRHMPHGRDRGDIQPLVVREARREGRDLLRIAVIDRQLVERPALGPEQRIHRTLPRACAIDGTCLRDVAHDRERPRRAAADEHAPVHRRQFLRLVHDDMAECPFSVVGGLLGGGALVQSVHVVDKRLGVHDSVADAVLRQSVTGDLLVMLALAVRRRLARLLVGVRSQQFHRLVKQRHIGTSDWRIGRTAQRIHLGGRQPRRIGVQLLGLGEHVGEHPLGCHGKPGKVHGAAEVVVHAQHRANRIKLRSLGIVVETLTIARHHGAHHGLDEGFARLVVRFAGASRVGDRLLDVGGAHRHVERVETNHRKPGWNALAAFHSVGDGMRHARVALERGDARRVLGAGGDAGQQRRHGARQNAGFAQRGEHLVNVMEECVARAHDEHAGMRQALAMRVQQISGAVQSHGGLAGARSALHDERLAHVGADDAVLFGLDRGDDVRHLARTAA